MEELLLTLAEIGVSLEAKEGVLEVSDPDKKITPVILERIKETKEELINLLDSSERVEKSELIPRAAIKPYYKLSSAQRRLFFLHQLDSESLAYNLPQVVELEGVLDSQLIKTVFQQLIARHESLRTSFDIIDEEAIQIIHDNVDFELEFFDPSSSDIQMVVDQFIRPFDLKMDSLIRVGLVKIEENSHLLMVDMHHIITDGMSQGILIKDFMSFYNNQRPPEISLQYKDYSEWNHSPIQRNRVVQEKDFWMRAFSEEVKALDLPTDFARPAIRNQAGGVVSFSLTEEETQALRSFNDAAGATMFMTVFAIFNVLLSKLSNQEDIVVGTPVAGRDHADLEGTIGMFVNTLVLRHSARPDLKFEDFLSEVQNKNLEFFANQNYQYEDLIDALNVVRDTSRNPLFDVMFTFQNFEHEELVIPALILKPYKFGRSMSKFDLTLAAVESEAQLFLNFQYSTALFAEKTIHRFVSYLKHILLTVIKAPTIRLKEIDILSETEKQQLLFEFNATRKDYPRETTISELFQIQALKTPNETAIVYKDSSLTYQEVDQHSNQLAIRLKGLSDKSRLVALYLEPSLEMAVSILGVLKAGMGFLPLDPDHASNRHDQVLKDSQTDVLIVGDSLEERLEFSGEKLLCSDFMNDGAVKSVEIDVSFHDVAYVIYTSGSTGNPKGVKITHRNLTNYITWFGEQVDLVPDDKLLLTTSFAFDAIYTQFFGSLLNGLELHILSKDDYLMPQNLINYISQNRISVLKMTPTLFNMLTNDETFTPSTFEHVRFIMLGGEPINVRDVLKVRSSNPNVRFMNHYGPTETTIGSIAGHIQDDAIEDFVSRPTIGKPINNTRCYIVSKDGVLVPTGCIGELYISGDGVGMGYLGDEQLTAKSFIEDPFCEGQRLYKSGDLCRWLPGGQLEYLGRIDDQIKIRGFRVELGEIESHLTAFEQIQECVVVARGAEGDKNLVAYYVSDKEIVSSGLRSHLASKLPEYMLPSYYVHMKDFPLTPNGKINRKVLPNPMITQGNDYVKPEGELEEKLTAIWSDILHVERNAISAERSFFDLGGHSLKATLLINKISTRLGVKVPLRTIFTHQDIRSLATYIQGSEKLGLRSIEKAKEKEFYNLSSAQQRMYFLFEFDKRSMAYNMPQVVQLEGKLDTARLENVFLDLIDRHESLRTTFGMVREVVVQKINNEVDFKISDFEANETEVQGIISQFIRPFNLNEDILIRVGVIKLSDRLNVLIVDMHHVISDGVSQGLLIQDFMSLYNGEELRRPKLQYKDYAEWQQAEEQQAHFLDQKKFWMKEFAQEPTILDLPNDFPRPAVKSHEGSRLGFSLSQEETQSMRRLADNQDATMFMTLLSIFNILLGKLSAEEDIIVGTSILGRDHEKLEGVVGMFVNVLTLRNYPKHELAFADFLATVKQKALACFENQSYQYDQLVEELKISRETNRNPLFDIMFEFQNFEQKELVIPGLVLRPYDSNHSAARRDLTLNALETEKQIHFNFHYSTDLFSGKTIQSFATYFKRIVTEVISDSQKRISEIAILSVEERDQILVGFNKTSVNYPADMTLVDLFEQQVMSTPENIALEFGDRKLTYNELNTKSNQLATTLQNKGVKKGGIVAISLERSIEMIISIVAILKSGGAYLPINKSQPTSRTQLMLKDAKVTLLIADTEGVDFGGDGVEVIQLNSGQFDLDSAENPSIRLTPFDLSYIIYTSGSTGMPKGVTVTHGAVVNLICAQIKEFGINQDEKILQFSSVAFDASVEQIWIALLTGAALVIVDKDTITDKDAFKAHLSSHAVTHLHATPSFLEQIDLNGLEHLRRIVAGGERCSIQLARKYGDAYQFYNEYGPTETTVTSLVHLYTEENTAQSVLPIGSPIDNTFVYILDASNAIQPVGVAGELCISGVGLSPGYLDKKELTQNSFVNNPFRQSEKMYRTGDMARWLPDGTVEFLGRRDDQVKVNGYRIELGEIQYWLKEHELIHETVVIISQKEDATHIVCYYVSDQEIEPAAIRSYLSEHVPDYMLPSSYVHMKHMPLTSNGKIDHKSLPNPEPTVDDDYVAPRTKEEKLLCEVWSKVLGIERIGITDNFFSVGGDSIRSIQICSRMKRAGYKLSVKDVITSQTIEALSAKLKEQEPMVPETVAVTGLVPLTGIQQNFFQGVVEAKNHYNQSVMLNFSDRISKKEASEIFNALQAHHDALRMVYKWNGESFEQHNQRTSHPLSILAKDLRTAKAPESKLLSLCNQLQTSINLESGPLMKIGLFDMMDGTRLVIVVHHLIIDGVSWRILFEDIEGLYQQIKDGVTVELPPKTDSFQQWALKLQEYTKTNRYKEACIYWDQVLTKDLVKITPANVHGKNTYSEVKTAGFQLTKSNTEKLMKKVHGAFNTQINDILLAGLVMSIRKEYDIGALRLDLEGHGREEILEGVDVSRTVGWFTSIYPILLDTEYEELSGLIKSVKEYLRNIPNNGMDYLISKYLTGEPQEKEKSKISFNYLGQFDGDTEEKVFSMASDPSGESISTMEQREYDWSFSGMVSGNRLGMGLSYSKDQHDQQKMEALMGAYQESLIELISYCSEYDGSELTPSDLTFKALSISQLTNLQDQYDIEDIYPLAPMQEGMLFHLLLEPESSYYFEQMNYRLKGELNIEAVENAFKTLVDRYAILRTVFVHSGYDRALQVVLKHRNAEFTFKDISAEVAKKGRNEAVTVYREADRARKFNLTEDVLMRVSVFKTGMEDYEFIWSHHHILMDGWCMSILVQEFSALYLGNLSGTPVSLPKVHPYSTYIAWLEQRNREVAKEYWRGYLEGFESSSSLPIVGEPSPTSEGKLSTVLTLNRAETKSLNELTQKYGVTLNTIVQTIWGILLSKYNSTRDVVFGVVVSGRPAEIEGIENMVGLFINTIPVRISYSDGDNIAELLQRVQEKAMASQQYHYSPLSEIQATSDLGMELLDHVMVFENYPIAEEIQGVEKAKDGLGSYSVTEAQTFEQNSYDLSIKVVPWEELKIEIGYNPNKYSQPIVERAKTHLKQIIQQVILDSQRLVSSIDILSESEREQLLHEFNTTATDYPKESTIASLFQAQVQTTPDARAVVFEEEGLTYKELDEQSDKLAEQLCQLGETHHLVAIYAEPCLEMIISVLAVLKAGMTFVPLDPDHQSDRHKNIIKSSACDILLTTEKSWELIDFKGLKLVVNQRLLKDQDKLKSTWHAKHADLAYVIYTSGSTGTPKGVEILQSNVVNYVSWVKKFIQITQEDKSLLTSSFSFDLGYTSIFPILLSGGELHLISSNTYRNPDKLLRYIEDFKISYLKITPSLFSTFFILDNAVDYTFSNLRYILLGGEAIRTDLVEKILLQSKNIQFVNHYGPSETTIGAIAQQIDQSSITSYSKRPTIGKPIHNTQCYILGRDGELLPSGCYGELCISGDGVGRGYLGDEQLTKEKFLKHPFRDDERLYKTGDVARWLPDGNIEFLGRIDEQIKVRGHRVELGEIEAQLTAYPEIDDVAVLSMEKGGDVHIVAYYVSVDEIPATTLTQYLSGVLPEYMLPSFYVHLSELPLTPNGKLDRRSLPKPILEAGADYQAPSTEIEEQLVEIWAEVLDVNKEVIGVNKSFFELGGHSLKSTVLANRIVSQFGITIPLKVIFTSPTVKMLALFIEGITGDGNNSESSSDQEELIF